MFIVHILVLAAIFFLLGRGVTGDEWPSSASAADSFDMCERYRTEHLVTFREEHTPRATEMRYCVPWDSFWVRMTHLYLARPAKRGGHLVG